MRAAPIEGTPVSVCAGSPAQLQTGLRWDRVSRLLVSCCLVQPAFLDRVPDDVVACGPARDLLRLARRRRGAGLDATIEGILAGASPDQVKRAGGRGYVLGVAGEPAALIDFERYLTEARQLGIRERLERAVSGGELSPDSLRAIADELATVVGSEQASAFESWVEPGVDFLTAEEQVLGEIIPGILAGAGFAGFFAEPKVGKSWLAYSIALAVGNGCDLLGQYPVAQPGRVLFIGAEGSRNGARARLAGLARGYGLEPEAALTAIDVVWRRPVALDDPAFLRWLTDKAPSYRLIVVDVLTKVWSGDEGDNAQVSALLRDIERITRCGPSFAIVHHFAKASEQTAGRRPGQRIRGASAWHAGLDSALYLERAKSATRTIVTVEMKDGAPADPFSFAWPNETVDGSTPVDLDWAAGEIVQAKAAELVPAVLGAIGADPGVSRTGLREVIAGQHQVLGDAVRLAIESRQAHERLSPRADKIGRVRSSRGLFLGAPEAEPALFTGAGEPAVPVPERPAAEGHAGTGMGEPHHPVPHDGTGGDPAAAAVGKKPLASRDQMNFAVVPERVGTGGNDGPDNLTGTSIVVPVPPPSIGGNGYGTGEDAVPGAGDGRGESVDWPALLPGDGAEVVPGAEVDR